MAGAYGILRFSKSSSELSGSPPIPLCFPAKNQTARVQQQLPENLVIGDPAQNHDSPGQAVKNTAQNICTGPIQAPIAAHSFTSPPPMPPNQKRKP